MSEQRDDLIPKGFKSKSEFRRIHVQAKGRMPTEYEWECYCDVDEWKRENPAPESEE